METPIYIFKEKGFPIVKVYGHYFEIKAIDYWEFRQFLFKEIKSIEYYNPNDVWYNKLYNSLSYFGLIFSKEDSWKLKIIKKNKGQWKYDIPGQFHSRLKEIIDYLALRCVVMNGK